MIRRRRRLDARLALIALVVAACSGRDAGYFPVDPSTATETTGPADTAQRALIGVVDLVAPEGNEVTLVRVEPQDATGDVATEAFALRRSDADGGGIGFSTVDEMKPGISFAAVAHPVPGYAFSSADGPVQLVLAFRAPSPTTAAFGGVVVVFRVGGGDERQQLFHSSGRVCFAHPAPTACPPASQ